MANAIVVIVVIIIMLFAGKGAYKHLKGGGGSKPEIPKKRLDGTKLGEKTMKITGMHCENCVASVTRAINRIDGAAAKVSLKKGEAVVSYDREISNEELKKVVEDRGYHVVSIQ
ncbi:heavy metal-associated domain-containing protein [Ruminococcus sp. SR1/5]|uniref:heavy-metal-associated domain-containing protein n=1 Tax=Ruminococcus sp. SR1/5 TaxID=657323 RepID=UPI0001CD55E3|nr:heavy metal-associated domain-containing protein [Ruminococcus sp. SR1/5]CBL20129.1 Copper chaperone [Ruminococcus sp. SR1/5]